MQQHSNGVRTFILISLLVSLYLGVRLVSIDSTMQTDEADWLGGAANVYTGVAHGDLSTTYQLPHPGATTLWTGVLAYMTDIPRYPSLRDTPVPYHRVDIVLRDLGYSPLELLVTARVYKLLLQTLLYAAALILLGRLAGPGLMTVTGLLITLDPFTVGYDRLLHIDGLVSIASFSAIIAIASASSRSSNKLWSLAGFLSAIAWLTRFTAGVLAIVALLAILVPIVFAYTRADRDSRQALLKRGLSSARWYTLSAGVTSMVLWPTLIVDPSGTFHQMWTYVSNAVTTGHELPTFYNGNIVHGDPGAGFYFDAVFWRLTPIVLLGLCVFIVLLAARTRRMIVECNLPLLLCSSGFIVFYFALMDAGAKKFDRYILPVMLPLCLIAAMGLVSLARLIGERAKTSQKKVAITTVLCGIVLFAQLGAFLPNYKYGVDFYNPLRGGITSAEDKMQVGAGEGLDLVADYILDQPGGSRATILSQTNQVTLLYFMPETAIMLNSGLRNDARGLDSWATADYYVSYLPQWKSDLNATVQDQATLFSPIYTVDIDGVTFSNVYDVRDIPPPPQIVDALPCKWIFDNVATLLAYRDMSIKINDDDPNLRSLSLHFLTSTQETYPIMVELVPRETGGVPVRLEGILPPSVANGSISTVSFDYTIPRGQTSDGYDIKVTLLDPLSSDTISTTLTDNIRAPSQVAVVNSCEDAGAVN